jgi:23S rRNA pseudouridine1911/1915/1917 synthase
LTEQQGIFDLQEDTALTFSVDAEAGERLDVFLSEKLQLTRSSVQNRIEGGFVCVNGAQKPKNYKLRRADTVCVTLPPLCEYDVVAQEIPLDILYEDCDLLVVNKPKGMVVHPAVGNPDGTLVNALLYHCKDSLSGINGVLRPGIVHRIDRDTSGLLVVAKNDTAHVSLAEQIASHTAERHYRAIVHGGFSDAKGTVCAPIGRHPTDRKKMAVVQGGREATTHYEVLNQYRVHTVQNGALADLKLRLETGRTHQIRVHLTHLGHPLLGDAVYGTVRHALDARYASLLQGQCLHAKSISFIHPKSGQAMHFESELPDYYTTLLQKIEADKI